MTPGGSTEARNADSTYLELGGVAEIPSFQPDGSDFRVELHA